MNDDKQAYLKAEAHRLLEIDGWTPEEVLRHWRFEPIGSPYFEGRCGERFTERYAELRSDLSDSEFTALSKRVGWEK